MLSVLLGRWNNCLPWFYFFNYILKNMNFHENPQSNYRCTVLMYLYSVLIMILIIIIVCIINIKQPIYGNYLLYYFYKIWKIYSKEEIEEERWYKNFNNLTNVEIKRFNYIQCNNWNNPN